MCRSPDSTNMLSRSEGGCRRAGRSSGPHKIRRSPKNEFWSTCWSGVVRPIWNWKCWHILGIHGRGCRGSS